jgi:hypothetical protein
MRELTEACDKLVAISAVAKEISMFGGMGEYLAGLWRSDILRDLLWFSTYEDRTDEFATPSRPDGYRAPSWSWASIDGTISWSKFPEVSADDSDMFVTFISATIDHVTADLFGEVRSAEIHLKGPLRTIFLVTKHGRFLNDDDKNTLLHGETQSRCVKQPNPKFHF